MQSRLRRQRVGGLGGKRGAAFGATVAAGRVVTIVFFCGGTAVESQLLLSTERFRVERLSWLAQDGRRVAKSVVRHPGAVAIVPVLDDGAIVLIRNRRVAVGEILLEIPAGTLTPGEDPAAAAHRELAEETGYRAGQLERLATFYMSPGVIDEIMHVFVARRLVAGSQQLEDDEEISTEVFSLAEAMQMATTGQIRDAKTLTALLLYQHQGAGS